MFDVRSQDETMSMSVIDLGGGNTYFACALNYQIFPSPGLTKKIGTVVGSLFKVCKNVSTL